MLLNGCSPSSNPSRLGYVEGTSDSGGGNGIENKVYEAYIVKPQSLVSYQKYINPIIQKLIQLAPKPDLAKQVIERWLLYKTWYIAPVSLGNISKDVIGVSFSEDNSEQLAIQTRRSIWINSNRFAAMSERDQAALIIHEMVMSLYYLRYKSWKEICKERIWPDIQCKTGDSEIMEDLFPGTTPKPFNSEDYENIRAVTGAFLSGLQFSSYKELDSFLIAHDFDRRFTVGLGIDSDNSRAVEINFGYETWSQIQMHKIFEDAPFLNRQVEVCSALSSNKQTNCAIQLTRIRHFSESGVTMPLNKLYGSGVGLERFENFNQGSSDIHVSFIVLKNEKIKLFYIPFSPVIPAKEIKRGLRFRSSYVVAIQDLNNPDSRAQFLGVVSIPAVVIAFEDGRCLFDKPVANSMENDIIFYSSKNLDLREQIVLRMRARSWPPVLSCRGM